MEPVAIGPFFFCPASEVYGRAPMFKFGCTLFLVFNFACGFSRTHFQLGVLRFCAGVFAGAPLGLSHSYLAEMWGPGGERGRPLSLNSLAAIIGPCFGQATGSLIMSAVSWRIIFWATTAIGYGTIFMMSVFIPDTKLFADKTIGNSETEEELGCDLLNELQDQPMSLKSTEDLLQMDASTIQDILSVLGRPAHIAFKDPVTLVIGFQQGLIHLIGSMARFSILKVVKDNHQNSTVANGFHCLYMTLGACLSSQATTKMLSRLCDWLHIKNSISSDTPEYQLRCMIPGTIILAIGSLMFALARYLNAHMAVIDVSLVLLGASTILASRKTTTYFIDKHKNQAASAMAVSTSFVKLATFFVPLILNLTEPFYSCPKLEIFLPLAAPLLIIPIPWILFRLQPSSAKSKISKNKGAKDV